MPASVQPSSLTPTCPAVPSPAAQLLLHKAQRQRQILRSLQPHCTDAMLQDFVENVFSDHTLVDAYFRPKPMAGSLSTRTLTDWIPLQVAGRAAAQAQAMGLIKPFERRLTHMAAFLYPSGLFHCVHSDAEAGRGGVIPDFKQIESLRFFLLEDALRRLKAQNKALANTLAAALGFAVYDEDINQEQVARIASAVYLANVQVSAIWAPAQA